MDSQAGRIVATLVFVAVMAAGAVGTGCVPADRSVPDPEPVAETPADEVPPVADDAEIVVPAVAGMTAADAERAFRDAGLDPSVAGVYTDSGAVGVVVEQRPRAGHVVSSDEVAVLIVSFGSRAKRGVLVPQVEGVRLATALDRLDARGLSAEVHYRDHHLASDGTVLWQAPRSDLTMDDGSTVVLVVARAVAREEPTLPSADIEME